VADDKPDPKPDPEAIARAIKELSPDEALVFLEKLERVYRRGRIQAFGYLVAMVVWAASMFLALVYAGTHDGFTVWIYLVPFALVGGVLYAFGKWANKIAPPRQR